METKMSAPATTTGISDEVRDLANQEYQYGFVTDLDTDVAPRGLNEDIIRLISTKKN
jgi:Fe-S cluster assembly protein SufB